MPQNNCSVEFYDSAPLSGKGKTRASRAGFLTVMWNCFTSALCGLGVVSLAVVDTPFMLLEGSRKRGLSAMGATVAVQLAVDLPRVFFAPIAKIVGVAFG